VYLPISLILNLIFKTYYSFGFNLGSSFLINSFNLLVIVMLVMFLAMLCALFNSFSGLAASWVYEKIEDINKQDIPEFTIEQ